MHWQLYQEYVHAYSLILIKLIFLLYNVHVGTVDLAVANLQTSTEKKNDESDAFSNGESSSLLLINFR